MCFTALFPDLCEKLEDVYKPLQIRKKSLNSLSTSWSLRATEIAHRIMERLLRFASYSSYPELYFECICFPVSCFTIGLISPGLSPGLDYSGFGYPGFDYPGFDYQYRQKAIPCTGSLKTSNGLRATAFTRCRYILYVRYILIFGSGMCP